jgi:NADP-dependent 3-hydroxy acid dehydrogenase YdfG
MSFKYKKILVIGATSGIGKGLAEAFLSRDIQIIASGRRADRLNQFVQQHGDNKVSAIPFDITKLKEIPEFVKK